MDWEYIRDLVPFYLDGSLYDDFASGSVFPEDILGDPEQIKVVKDAVNALQDLEERLAFEGYIQGR